jgi:mannose-6-phosphate isomerase-like protein (cupin superfamily)
MNAGMRPTEPFVVLPGEGQRFRGPVGGPARIVARAETTGDAFTAIENVIPPQQGPPLHVHGREDEMYLILDGHLRFKAGGRLFDAPAGSFVFIPRVTPHCFQNIGEVDARLLVMFAPSGMERFFEGLGSLPPGPVDPAVYRSIAAEAAMEVVGPPLAESDPIQQPDSATG